MAAAEDRGLHADTPLFLPYLHGERTPHNDPFARGVFFGMTSQTARADLIVAVLEGVALAFADGLDTLLAAGGEVGAITAVGGGVRHGLWLDYLSAALGPSAGAAQWRRSRRSARRRATRSSGRDSRGSGAGVYAAARGCRDLAAGRTRRTARAPATALHRPLFAAETPVPGLLNVSPASRCGDWPDRVATLAVFFANGLGLGAWAAAIPALKSRLALSDGQLSVALLSFACGAFISMPLAGWIGSRVRTGHATLVAGIAFAVSLFVPAFTRVLPALCGAAAMVGACTGAVDVLMNVHASSIELPPACADHVVLPRGVQRGRYGGSGPRREFGAERGDD